MATQFSFGTLNYLILLAYLAFMLGIGFRLSRRQTSTQEYFLANRRMPWFVVALSMFASVTSAITYMGVPGTVYGENTSFVLAAVISPIVAPFLIYLFYPFYRRLKVTTCYEYIDRRFGGSARYAVCILFLLARLALSATIWVQTSTQIHWIWYFQISFTIATSAGLLFSLLLGGSKADRALTLWGRSQLGHLE